MPQQTRQTTFAADRRGGVAITFAFMLVPILLATGFVIDYGRARAMRDEIQIAADAAVLAVLSPEYKPGEADKLANQVFMANLSAQAKGVLTGTPKLTVTKSSKDGVVTAKLEFSASVETTFMKIANIDKVVLNGESEAKNSTKRYIDIHVLLDTSDSMGVGASAADRLRMRQVSSKKKAELRNAAIDKLAPGDTFTEDYLYPDIEDKEMNGYRFLAYDKKGVGLMGCEFACHVKEFANYKDSMEMLARENKINLRIDVAKAGIKQVADLATAASSNDAYVRMGLSSFSTTLVKHLDPTVNLNAFKNKLTDANGIGLGTGANASSAFKATFPFWGRCWNNVANTFFDANVPAFADYLGDWRRKAASGQTGDSIPMQVVLLVTDGLKSQNCAAWGPTLEQAVYPFRPADCEKLKATGALVAVVYTEYINSPLPSYEEHAQHAVEESSGFKYSDPEKSPGIEKNLTACASPGLFAKGKEPAEIEKAFKTVFNNLKLTTFLSR